jgi:hypothetical protein
MKFGRQKNGEDFLTQPIHVLEHLMPLNSQSYLKQIDYECQ